MSAWSGKQPKENRIQSGLTTYEVPLVTGFAVGMADLGIIEVTVANPTDVTDAVVVALAV